MAKTCLKMAILFLVASHCILLSMACASNGDCLYYRCDVGNHPICSKNQCTCVPDSLDGVQYCHNDKDCKPLCPPNCGITNCIGGRCICSC
ncbi:putative defensin-like protein 263 [Mercurialis annua]|uniref:putative defensin-like protein 263 n=1 Tax=Mercurialis annua TaxID=3986 RepID=UPI002160456F|nr:putative defensin-like protein 263 [Mercurialis annua]